MLLRSWMTAILSRAASPRRRRSVRKLETLEDRTLLTAPELVNVSVTTTLDQNEIATLTGTIVDPDVNQSHTLVVDWGDGTVQGYNFAAGVTQLTGVTHRYSKPGTFQVEIQALVDSGGELANLDRPFQTSTSITMNVSVGTEDVQGNNESRDSAMSADGRYIVFESTASNLVDGDTNSLQDIFVYDTHTGVTKRVSVSSAGAQSNGSSDNPDISADGRYVVFQSAASNLVAGDTNSQTDIFRHDLQTGETIRVSTASNGSQGVNGSSTWASSSGDGRFIAFQSTANNLVAGDTNNQSDVFVKDLKTGLTTRVSKSSTGTQGNAGSQIGVISETGRFVVFDSVSNNLVASDTNNASDIFRHDLVSGTTIRVSVTSFGNQANSGSQFADISADGRYISFHSDAANLVAGDNNTDRDVFVRDVVGQTTTRVSVRTGGIQVNGTSDYASISSDGKFVAFESTASNLVDGDTNGLNDIFVHEIATGTTSRVNVDSAGFESNGSSFTTAISGGGRFVSFYSRGTNLVSGDTNSRRDVFVHDRGAGKTIRASIGSANSNANGSSISPSISADGRFIAFQSSATNLLAADTTTASDIYVLDSLTGQLELVSVNTAGQIGNGSSFTPSISGDGRFVVFHSIANNLFANDVNLSSDVFVHDRQTKTTTPVSVSSSEVQGNGDSLFATISTDGKFVVFESLATNLVANDTNNSRDIFVRDLLAGTTTRVSVDSAGGEANSLSAGADISGDGRYISFHSFATDLVSGDSNGTSDIFVHDRLTGDTERVSTRTGGTQSNGISSSASISDDGRYVVFQSQGNTLVSGDNNSDQDVFLHDRVTNITTRVSVNGSGGDANDGSGTPEISGDGRFVSFVSSATNLAPGISNGVQDVFIADRITGEISRVSVSTNGAQSNGNSFSPAISHHGRFVVYDSIGTTLFAKDQNGESDIILADLGKSRVQVRHNADQVGVFRNGNWFLDANGNGTFGTGDSSFQFGIGSDTPIKGDWDGDGDDEIGIHRFVNVGGTIHSRFYLDTNGNGSFDGTGPGQDRLIRFGVNGDTPLVGDWDGDGKDELGIHRFRNVGGTLQSQFLLDANGNGVWDGTGPGQDIYVQFGIANDKPISGDFNGDGVDTVGVHRFANVGGTTQSRFYIDANGNGRWDGTGAGQDIYHQFGIGGDTAVIGDWNGDGTDTVGVHRFASVGGNTESRFYLDVDGNGQFNTGDLIRKFGVNNDIPVIGKWV